jgi:hypothetical protein
MSLQMEEVKAMREVVHRVAYTVGDKHYEISSRPGESFEALVTRVEARAFGGAPADEQDFCWDSDCTRTVPPYGVYHVQICAATQAQLDEDVARYCAMTTHDCDECK